MPFTFSHPAAILPATLLPKRYYSFTGLIAGSVVPDFEYFIRVSVNSEYSHTISGIFWFNMPLTFILAWLYHEIVKKPLIGSLPDFFRLRIQTFSSFNWKVYVRKNWGIVLVSIIIGAATHLLWDSFTHEESYFARVIPFLAQEYTIGGYTIAGFKLAQHVSTIIGGLILLLYVYNLPLKQEVVHTKYTGYWWIAILITITVIGIKLMFGIEAHLVNNIIIAGMSGAMLALVITPALLSVFVKAPKPR
jgi:hypothetical protein